MNDTNSSRPPRTFFNNEKPPSRKKLDNYTYDMYIRRCKYLVPICEPIHSLEGIISVLWSVKSPKKILEKPILENEAKAPFLLVPVFFFFGGI